MQDQTKTLKDNPGGTVHWDVENYKYPYAVLELTGSGTDRTLQFPKNAPTPGSLVLKVVQGGGGGNTISFAQGIHTFAGINYTPSGTPGQYDVLTFVSTDGRTWNFVPQKNGGQA